MNFEVEQSNQLFFNPRINESDKKILFELKNEFEKKYSDHGYFLIPSSGSSKSVKNSVKLIALKIEAVLNSAKRFNQFFDVKNPIWGLVLPEYHIAGIAIYARAFLSKSKVAKSDWQVENFRNWLINENVTHLSLVPTQIFDILKQEIECPPQIQVVLVGGAKLSSQDKSKIAGLGWPCYETYGMTETASLIACRNPHQDQFQVLPNVQVKSEGELLKINCDSLLTCSIQKQNDQIKIWSEIDQDGFLQTEDRVLVHDNKIDFLGRDSDFVKVNGMGVSLLELREKLEQIDRRSTVLAQENMRSGNEIILVTEQENSDDIKNKFNEIVKPYERITETIFLEKLPRTDLGKIKIKELEFLLGKGKK